jgi:bacterioferritin-associated ferredoxin
MYVCICHAVTDQEIRACIAEGARSMRELRAELKVATRCGKCACDVRALLKEQMRGSPRPAFASASVPASFS